MRKPTPAFETTDDCISGFPEDTQDEADGQAAAPEAQEVSSYRMPTFSLNGRNLVHFAAFENDIGFYRIPSGIEAFKRELAS